MVEGQPSDVAVALPSQRNDEIVATVLRVAWMAVALGVGMEILILVVTAAFGGAAGVKDFVAGIARTVPWSFLVCTGIAFGKAASRAPAKAMGITGLLAAPIAFTIARTIHRGTAAALGVAATGGLAAIVLAVIKGLEYACLGAGLGWLGQRRKAGLATHIAFGLLVGLVFGGSIVVLSATAVTPAPSTGDLAGKAVDEMIFPLGCSLVLFAAEVWGKRTAA